MPSTCSPTVGGVVLCGGKSTRMGRAKADLPFGSETMLQRVVRILSEVVAPIVVVAARGQVLPHLPEDIIIARDEQENLGPLGGLAAGLPFLKDRVDAVYASSCDVPLLKPEFVRSVIEALGEDDLAIPRDGQYHHPLAAVYRTRLYDAMCRLIAENRLRPFYLLQEARAREIDVSELRRIDPELVSLRNTNTPEEYQAALQEAGLTSSREGPCDETG
jgi:molybdenum cofactor guanylyltransferase